MSDFTKAFISLSDAQSTSKRVVFSPDPNDPIKAAFETGKYLGILPNTSFEQFTSSGYELKFHSQKSLYDIRLKPKKMINLLGEHLLEFAQENNQVFSVDHKWRAEEITSNINHMTNHEYFKIIHDKYDQKTCIHKITLSAQDSNTNHEFSCEFAHELVSSLNEFLNKAGHTHNFYGIMQFSDSPSFLYLEKTKASTAFTSDFLDIGP